VTTARPNLPKTAHKVIARKAHPQEAHAAADRKKATT
jgi:hypothetical protein